MAAAGFADLLRQRISGKTGDELEAATDDAADGCGWLEIQVDPTSYAPFVGGITPGNAGDFLALPCVACVGGSWVAPDETVSAGGGVLGRPHLAAILVKKGYASSIQNAFDKYLGKGKPAFRQNDRAAQPSGPSVAI